MKITDVRPWIVTGPPTEPGVPGHAGERLHYVFVQVDTDEGLTGWGEITTYPGLVAVSYTHLTLPTKRIV